ncbi:hypothetical protein Q5752_002961 [Cryptotrichosporon argae]
MPLEAIDYELIRQASQRYAWALDTGDVAGFLACFVPETGYLQVQGVPAGHALAAKVVGSNMLREFVEGNWRLLQGQVRHLITGELIEEIEPGLASYRAMYACIRPGTFPSAGVLMSGEYDDIMQRVDGRWLILARRPYMDESRPARAAPHGLIRHFDAVHAQWKEA